MCFVIGFGAWRNSAEAQAGALVSYETLARLSLQPHFRRTEQARKPASIGTARIHPWGRLAQLSESPAPILYEFVACSLKHFKCIN